MLYLLRSPYKDNNGKFSTILKLGYAKDLERRIYQYQSHNPSIEVLHTREGDLVEESLFHLCFHALGYGYIMSEWYKDEEDLINIFHDITIPDLEKLLWDIRDKAFPDNLFIASKIDISRKNVYTRLYNRFGGSIQYEADKGEDGRIIEKTSYRVDDDYYSAYVLPNLPIPDCIKSYIEEFNSFQTFIEKMKFLCSLDLMAEEFTTVLERIPMIYKNYYIVLGPDRIKSLSYHSTKIKEEYDRLIGNQDIDLKSEIYNVFQVGYMYTLNQIKLTLKDIYNRLEYKETPKAKTIESFFNIKRGTVLNKETGKRDECYKIISKK